MAIQVFERSVRIARPVSDVFAWHERPGALQRLTPPWEKVAVLEQRGGIRKGGRVVAAVRIGPVKSRWEVEHVDYEASRQFRDVQRRGLFRVWEHTHLFEPDGEGGTVLADRIRFELPGAALGRLGHGTVHARLDRMFRYRHAVTKADLELPPAEPGRVVITGASGLLGNALVPYLQTQGWQVWKAVRRRAVKADEIAWDPAAGSIDWPDGVAFDAVIHLAGANLAEGRWTEERKRVIRESRIQGTRTLVQGLQRAAFRPRVVLSGSAIGYYGDTGNAVVDERAAVGGGFLADICRGWEEEVSPLDTVGVRTVRLRTGVVLTPAGGALARLEPLFRAGMGGKLGHGRQWMSWIALDDWLDGVRAALTGARIAGAVNLVAPQPVTNAEFTRTLAQVVRRPAVATVPAIALKAALGQMADEALLSGARVEPAKLLAAGHRFRFADLEPALRHALGRYRNV